MSSQLKAARRARGLAIWGLSVMSGVSPSLLTAIEKWGYVPSAGTRERIATALGVQVEELWLTEEEQSTPGTADTGEDSTTRDEAAHSEAPGTGS